MLDALISGKLIKKSELKTSSNGNAFTNFILAVSTGQDTENIVITGVTFGDNAERIAKLGKGDALAIAGSLKPSEWEDKRSGEKRSGLNVIASQVL